MENYVAKSNLKPSRTILKRIPVEAIDILHLAL